MSKKKLDLPPPNILIPKNFDVLPKDPELSGTPILLQKFENADLWYKKDDKFERPHAQVKMKLYTNDNGFCIDGTKKLFVNVWKEVYDEYLRELKYMADCANLTFSCVQVYDSLNFSWSGFNDSMPNFILESIRKMQEMKEHNLEDIFNNVKEKLMMEWKNHYLNQSYRQALSTFPLLIYEKQVEMRTLRKLLEPYTY